MKPGFAFDEAGYSRMTRIVLGKVVDVHPEHNSVDIRVLSDRRRLIGVPVVGSGNTGTTGVIDLPVPDLTTGRDEDSKWVSGNTDKRDIMAVVAFVEGAPVCLGFCFPPITEMTFEGDEAKERRLYRHASDYYSLIDKDGNVEVAHPSGTWFGMSERPSKTRLTEKDYDKQWQVKRNLARAVHGVISWWNGGEKKEKARAHVTPGGDLLVWLNEKLRLLVGADGGAASALEMGADGKITMHANGGVRISFGPGSSGGATVPTPSFQPSETPGGERYDYPGVQASLGAAVAEITIDDEGNILLRATREVKIVGDVVIDGNLTVSGTATAAHFGSAD